MSEAVQTAVEVFNSEVLPILEKWGYSVSIERNEPNEVAWEIRWGDWKCGIEVELKVSHKRVFGVRPTYLQISGGFYRAYCDPNQISKDIIFRRLKSAVEAALVFLSREELMKVYYYSKVLKNLWWMRRHTTWVTSNDYRYRCRLKISLSKRRPSWRWVCEFAEPGGSLRKLCELKPTEEVINPTEAFVKFSRATIAETLL
jgi:hypothetical protein